MKIVVFGAGGLIGGWICEEFAGQRDVELVPCVRHWSSAVRLARRGLSVVQVDLEDVTENLAAIAGADIVVNASKPLPKREAELGLRLFSACAAAKVQKLVQFSSIAIYGNQTGNIDEDTRHSPVSEYGRGKAEMENRLLKAAAQSGPQLFILRPTIVYGPFSEYWTVLFARRIASGHWRSFGWAGEGTCNLVHAQDVARSVMSVAFAKTDSKSNVLNINGSEAITWNEYIERFGDALSISDRTKMSPLRFTLSSAVVHGVRTAGRWIKNSAIRRPLQSRAPAAVEKTQSLVDLYPPPGELQVWRWKARYSCERAVRVIGFHPSISIDSGLRQSADWCRTHGVVS